jgi:hypothetical protein
LIKKTGQPVRDLKATDFELVVDDIKQDITYFSEDQLPLSVLLLLDVSKVLNVLTVGAMHGLDDYSAATGGELVGAKKKEIDDRLDKLINHLRARYSMGFKPPETTVDGKLHRIKLTISPAALKQKGKFTVRTRTGYYLRRLHRE